MLKFLDLLIFLLRPLSDSFCLLTHHNSLSSRPFFRMWKEKNVAAKTPPSIRCFHILDDMCDSSFCHELIHMTHNSHIFQYHKSTRENYRD